MITSKLFLVADRAIRDVETNNLSIINLIDEMTVESFPVLIHRLTGVIFLNKDSGESDKPLIHLKLLNNEKIISNNPLKVDFKGKDKARALIQLNSVPLAEPGLLNFILYDDMSQQINQHSIELKIREEIKVVS